MSKKYGVPSPLEPDEDDRPAGQGRQEVSATFPRQRRKFFQGFLEKSTASKRRRFLEKTQGEPEPLNRNALTSRRRCSELGSSRKLSETQCEGKTLDEVAIAG